METKALTMSISSVAAVTTQTASATQAASASVVNPPASATPSASAAPLTSTHAGDRFVDTRRTVRDIREGVPTPRILVLTSEEKRLTSLSPFQRREGCDKIGKVARCDALRDGSLEVEFVHESDARKALLTRTFSFTTRVQGQKRLTTLAISVTPHRTKNTSRGVITCYDLKDTTEEEVVDGLASSGVVNAHRIKARRGNELIPTNSFILTFDMTDLPREVSVGYIKVQVRPYIPSPMRCFRCQRFGHTKTYCRGRATCAKCASTEHTDEECDATVFRCANCKEGENTHSSYDKACPTFLKEKEINSIKVTRGISFREARDIYSSAHPAVTYAQKAKAPVHQKTTLEEMSALQLLTLLRSHGLAVVAAGAMAEPVTMPLALATATPLTPGMTDRVHESHAASSVSDAPAAPVAPSVEVGGADQDDGWTLVRPVRSVGKRNPHPPAGSAAPPPSSALADALRLGEEARKAREAKRARLAEKAKEARRSPDVASAASYSDGERSNLETRHEYNPPRMGPPLKPPPARSSQPPSQPSAPGTSDTEPPPATPPAVKSLAKPPSAPSRPAKRDLSWAGSPTDDSGSHAKMSLAPSRSRSADGRAQQGGVRSRIRFESGSSGTSDHI